MYTKGFYKDLFERTVSTFAQAFLAYAGGNLVGVVEFDWFAAFSIAAMAAVLSVFKGFAAGAGEGNTGASFGTATPVGDVAAVEDVKVEGRYEAGEAVDYPAGTPVDVTPEATPDRPSRSDDFGRNY